MADMQDNAKHVPIAVLAELTRELLAQGNEVCLTVSGGSMAPFLVHQRDSVLVSQPNGSFRRGDIVFYQRSNGAYIMHRIVGIDKNGDLSLCGDAQTHIETSISPKQVFGIVRTAYRKGKKIDTSSFIWWLFRVPWRLCLPARHKILCLYYTITKKNGRKK